MDQELERESQLGTSTTVETNAEKKTAFENLPRIEDLLKSEKEVKTVTQIQGVTKVATEAQAENRTFARKEDETKNLVKKRVKIITTVYASIVALLLTFVGINLGTMIAIDKDINSAVNTKQVEQVKLDKVDKTAPGEAVGDDIVITLNPPRDYSDDVKELTFLDKVTIFFRHLFG